MNFEFEDYRKRPEPEDIGQWPFYYVPARMVKAYLFKIFVFFYILPILLFGSWFGSLATFFLYFVVWDVLEYYNIKKRIYDGE